MSAADRVLALADQLGIGLHLRRGGGASMEVGVLAPRGLLWAESLTREFVAVAQLRDWGHLDSHAWRTLEAVLERGAVTPPPPAPRCGLCERRVADAAELEPVDGGALACAACRCYIEEYAEASPRQRRQIEREGLARFLQG